MKKLAIVGAEEHTRHLAPYTDTDFEIWVFNEWGNAPWCQRWDRCIQLHKPKVYRDPNNRKDPQHWGWLQRRHGRHIYMQEIDPLVPDSVKYPLDGINARFMSNLRYEDDEQQYIRATVCYAIALALFERRQEIHIYGVELASHAEYRSQRDNFLFWIGAAIGAGTKVVLHCCKGMFNSTLYAYEDDMTEDQIHRYIEGISLQLEEAKKKVLMLEGAQMLAMQMLDDQKSAAIPVQIQETAEPMEGRNNGNEK